VLVSEVNEHTELDGEIVAPRRTITWVYHHENNHPPLT
jgi:hypothetical protein